MSLRIKFLLMSFLFFLFSLVIRIALVSKGPYSVDCLNLAIKSEAMINTGQLTFLFGSGYPMTVILGAFFVFIFKLFGMTDPVMAVNMMSVVFGALSSAVFYVFVNEITDQSTAFFSSILFSISPIFLSVSTYGMSHAPSLFFIILSFYFLVLHEKRESQFAVWASAISLGLAGATRIQEVFFVMPSVIYFLLVRPFHKESNILIQFKKILMYGCVCLLTIILFHLWYLLGPHKYETIEQIKWYLNFWVTGPKVHHQKYFSEYFLISLNDIYMNTTMAGIGCFLGGIITLFVKHRRLCLFLLIWFLIPTILIGNSVSGAPRMLLVLTAPMFIFIGYLITKMIKHQRFFRYAGLGVFLLIFISMLIVVLPPLMYRHTASPIKDFSEWISNKTEPNAVIIGGDERYFIEYYTQRKVMGRPISYFDFNSQSLVNFRTEINELLNRNLPVYITNTALLADNPGGEFNTFMRDQFKLVLIGKHLSEDWHQDIFRFRLGFEKVFKIEFK